MDGSPDRPAPLRQPHPHRHRHNQKRHSCNCRRHQREAATVYTIPNAFKTIPNSVVAKSAPSHLMPLQSS